MEARCQKRRCQGKSNSFPSVMCGHSKKRKDHCLPFFGFARFFSESIPLWSSVLGQILYHAPVRAVFAPIPHNLTILRSPLLVPDLICSLIERSWRTKEVDSGWFVGREGLTMTRDFSSTTTKQCSSASLLS